MDAVNMLSESYIGVPSMCNVTAASVNTILGLDSQAIMHACLREHFQKQFNAKQFDHYFLTTERDWDQHIAFIINDPAWRSTIYDLLATHTTCAFLNFIVLKISEAGYQQEVAHLKTASTYVRVYNMILENAFTDIVTKDDIEFDHTIPNLVRVCCERQETYLYAQILIRRVYDEFGAEPLTRLRRELEKVAKARGNRGFVDLLNSYMSHTPSDILKIIKSIMNGHSITPGDVIMLRRMYDAENPPPAHHLCNYDLIVKFLKALYVPHNGQVLRAEMVDNVTFLVAYATTVNDAEKKDNEKQEVETVQQVLKALYQAISPKTEMGTMSGATKYIISAIRFPVGSIGVLFWLEYMATHTTYFETYFRTSQVPTLHLFIDEIASRHQLQQPIVFEVIKTCIRHKYALFAPEILMALQKTWVDRMLYLVQLGYTTPILKFFGGMGRDLDDSLIVHFVKKILRMAQAPYSTTFVQHMVSIVEPIIENLKLIKDVEQLVITFLEEAIHNSELSPEYQERIRSILNQCRK
ncbi:hypothetical protein K501DRAFT_102696 [Backusella circina FSU 941]|nr:hypothetical protein K501DRAFT_102696 [Backusella circina FSU 941]